MASRKDQSKREGTPIYFVVATTSHCYSGCHKEKNVFDHCHGSGSSKRGAPVMRRHHRSCKDLTLLEYHKPLSPCTSNTSLVQFINFLPQHFRPSVSHNCKIASHFIEDLWPLSLLLSSQENHLMVRPRKGNCSPILHPPPQPTYVLMFSVHHPIHTTIPHLSHFNHRRHEKGSIFFCTIKFSFQC